VSTFKTAFLFAVIKATKCMCVQLLGLVTENKLIKMHKESKFKITAHAVHTVQVCISGGKV
jgi:hypothetical protein